MFGIVVYKSSDLILTHPRDSIVLVRRVKEAAPVLSMVKVRKSDATVPRRRAAELIRGQHNHRVVLNQGNWTRHLILKRGAGERRYAGFNATENKKLNKNVRANESDGNGKRLELKLNTDSQNLWGLFSDGCLD